MATMTTQTYRFRLAISYAEYEQKYYGKAYLNVVVRSDNGLRISFPAGRLIPFITRQCMYGRFELTTDAEHRFLSLAMIHAD